MKKFHKTEFPITDEVYDGLIKEIDDFITKEEENVKKMNPNDKFPMDRNLIRKSLRTAMNEFPDAGKVSFKTGVVSTSNECPISDRDIEYGNIFSLTWFKKLVPEKDKDKIKEMLEKKAKGKKIARNYEMIYKLAYKSLSVTGVSYDTGNIASWAAMHLSKDDLKKNEKFLRKNGFDSEPFRLVGNTRYSVFFSEFADFQNYHDNIVFDTIRFKDGFVRFNSRYENDSLKIFMNDNLMEKLALFVTGDPPDRDKIRNGINEIKEYRKKSDRLLGYFIESKIGKSLCK